MNFKPTAALLACFTPLSSSADTSNVDVYGGLSISANIDIVFNYSYDSNGFFADSGRKTILEAAASVFEARIMDSLTAIAPADGNTFQVSFPDPSNPLGTIQPATNHYQVGANQIIINVGGANLGGSTLGEGGPGGYQSSGSSAFVNNAARRGQPGVTNGTDFAPWGGFISFNNAFGNWFFDTSLNTDNDISGVDFYSVALHEIAHVLGAGTAPSWYTYVSGSTFNGPNTDPTQLDANRYHWADGTLSTINGVGSFEAALDPSLTPGQRKIMTDLDWNAMRDIGWQVAAVPEPETWAMLLAGLGLVAVAARRRREG